MGWSFRKSLRVLPGLHITLSKGGPRLSVGVPGSGRVSICTAKHGSMGKPAHFAISRV
jgi:hypothetical protein